MIPIKYHGVAPDKKGGAQQLINHQASVPIPTTEGLILCLGTLSDVDIHETFIGIYTSTEWLHPISKGHKRQTRSSAGQFPQIYRLIVAEPSIAAGPQAFYLFKTCVFKDLVFCLVMYGAGAQQ